MGGGSLNDYGRALFASEFTAAENNASAEAMVSESGFLGKKELPWWIRPGFKFRGMFLKTRLEDSNNSTTRTFPMQISLNTAFPLDKKSEKLIVTSVDYAPVVTNDATTSSSGKKPMSLVAKEYYYRWQLTKGYILYAGLMEKPYGIRHADHTAVNRGMSGFGLSESDQSHGLILQYNKDEIEAFFDLFFGNLSQDAPLRQKGLSLTTEYAYDKKITFGASLLKSSNEYLDMKRIGVHTRIGYTKGKSVIAEIGIRSDKPLKISDPEKNGYYSYIQSLVSYSQGYNILTTYQIYKDDMTSTGTARNRLGLGMLCFPWKKTEIRAELINDRTVADQNSVPDTWTAQTQVHVSW